APPSLQEPGDVGKVRVQPVLLLVRLRALAQIDDHLVDAVGQVLPASRHPRHVRLTAELALRTDFTGDTGHFRGEGAQLVDHLVDRLLEVEDLPLGGDGDLPRQVAARDRRGDQRDVAYLVGQVAGQHVHVVGQVLPDAGDAANVRLSA